MCVRAAAAEKELADVQAVKDEMAIVDEKLARATSHQAKAPLQARRRELQVLIFPYTTRRARIAWVRNAANLEG